MTFSTFFILCFVILPLSVAGMNQTIYHTMLYVKVLNYTAQPSYGVNPSTAPDSCCRKMPLQNCTHFCETVFSVCIGRCNSILFNITYNYDSNRVYDENYGVGNIDLPSVKGQNIIMDVTEIQTNIKTGTRKEIAIDRLLHQYSRPPYSNFWLSRMLSWRFHNRTIVQVQVRAFCESDWYNPQRGCSEHVPATDLQSVHYSIVEHRSFPELDCKTDEVSKINFITSRPYKYTRVILEAQLAKFLADKVCSSIAYGINVVIVSVRYKSPVLRVVFSSHCSRHVRPMSVSGEFVEISDLKILQALSYITPYEERQYFTDPVERKDLSNFRRQGQYQMILRLKRFSNPENIYFKMRNRTYQKEHCPQNGCIPSFSFLYNGNEQHLPYKQYPAANLTDCFGELVNPLNTTEQSRNSILLRSHHAWNTNNTVKLSIYHHFNRSNIIAIFDISLNMDAVGSSFAHVRPKLINYTNLVTNVSVEIETMVWCSNGYYGSACNMSCQSNATDCNIPKCTAGHSIANFEAFHCRKGQCNKGTCICPDGLAGPMCNVASPYSLPFDMDYHFQDDDIDTTSTVKCQDGYKGFNCDEYDYCSSNPCRYGRCINRNNGYSCVCDEGYLGYQCEVDIDYCSSHTCLNNGTCIEEISTYTCSCLAGYTGRNCEVDIDYCTSDTCHNNGTCHEEISNYTCSCHDGYTGRNCETDIDYCARDTCYNNGTCHEEISNYTCTCHDGYTGRNCETDIDYCARDTCYNNGTCYDEISNYTCSCHAGYTGRNCEIDIDYCARDTCQNNGTCHEEISYYTCTCLVGYTGRICETDIEYCARDTCYNNGTCHGEISNYTCTCHDGYTGRNCETDIEYCARDTCYNNGTCHEEISNYTCTCHDGYTGRNCETDIDYCARDTCYNNGTCHEEVSNYACTCHAGYIGRNCETDIDYCARDTCYNNGTCHEEVSNYTCTCHDGYTGRNCETDIDYCARDTCYNNGTCHEEVSNYTCSCHDGYTGRNCETDIDYCTSDTCHNSGTCHEEISNYTCSCHDGYTGRNCETDIDYCTSDTCYNNGTCHEEISNYTCSCHDGYTGRNCETDIDYCTSDTCHNNGTCHEEISNYTCSCHDGYTGRNCETDIDYCTSGTCHNNGTCHEEISNYACSCHDGYTGRNCETDIDYCTSDTCHNNGTCHEEISNYTCSCHDGYTGRYCETDIDYCTSDTCHNNGTCHEEVSNYTCSCSTGYTGRKCTHIIHYCTEHACTNNGTCIEGAGNFSCRCHDGFGGRHCEIDLNNSTKTRDAIDASCSTSGWNISINITILKQLYPLILLRNIHFGENSCRGKEFGNLLLFQQSFGECLTSKQISGNTLLYVNDLYYAIYDRNNPFIIRRHEWTFAVQCDVNRNQATSSHVHHDVNAQHIEISGQYGIKMAFFKDVNFMNQLPGNPLHVNVGDDIYVKVFTTASDWSTKMRLHTCYTKPYDIAEKNMTYYIIKDGCEVDSNTHIISQSTHETRFVFQDFEYSTNREGLNIYCNATFCDTKDYSPGCAQSCISPGTQALIGK